MNYALALRRSMSDDRTVSTLAEIKRALSSHQPRRIILEGMMKQAAVAAILREQNGITELLFIRRAEHPKDPWSGHMAFPGGRVDQEDKNAFAAAKRETLEELALDLDLFANPIGELSHVLAMAHGKPLPMVILPYVFELVARDVDPALVPSDEVQESIWVPLSFLEDQKNRSTLTWSLAGTIPFTLPCYRYEGRTIWGLTLSMIDELLALFLPAL
jgi:8-oxo-dGTP pyrophosphatase MutT (NUDIX family)